MKKCPVCGQSIKLENQDLVTFKEMNGGQWSDALDTASAQDLYFVTGTPTDFVIDRDGYIAYLHIGLESYADLSTAIDKVL
jgi:hypothetical protein